MALSNERKLELFDDMLDFVWSASEGIYQYVVTLAMLGLTKEEVIEDLKENFDYDNAIQEIVNEVSEEYEYWNNNEGKKVNKMKKLLLLMGAPGSGKSYWAHQFIKEHKNVKYISRDMIRFSLLKDNDRYFSKEDEVYKTFISNIQEALDDESTEYVIADATHVNLLSRQKTLGNLDTSEAKVIVCYRKVPLELCFERNDLRTGRSHIKPEVIKDLYYKLSEPILDIEKNIDELVYI